MIAHPLRQREQKSTVLLTIDVEDWFQVENFKPWISFSSWNSKELRVEKNVHCLLDLFDSITVHQSTTPKVTFFILGWVAKKFPDMVREIVARGHEVASHGFNHHLCISQSHDELEQDLVTSKELLEDITGAPVIGYRAPSFAINDLVLQVIEKCGYAYDSSYNSFDKHGRYGTIDLSDAIKMRSAYQLGDNFYELPISNLSLGGYVLPWGGGGYFRLIPTSVFFFGVRSILNKQDAYLFYMHPWEIDFEQPRVKEASQFFKFRHYVNIKRTEMKMANFIYKFRDCRFMTCSRYLLNDHEEVIL